MLFKMQHVDHSGPKSLPGSVWMPRVGSRCQEVQVRSPEDLLQKWILWGLLIQTWDHQVWMCCSKQCHLLPGLSLFSRLTSVETTFLSCVTVLVNYLTFLECAVFLPPSGCLRQRDIPLLYVCAYFLQN